MDRAQELKKGAERPTEDTYLVSVVGINKHQIPASGRGGSLRQEQGSLGSELVVVEDGLAGPSCPGYLPSGLGSCQRKRQSQASLRPGGCLDWSLVSSWGPIL